MEYYFKYRRKNFLFFRKYKVIGHTLNDKTNKMVLYFKDGGVREIVDWANCELHLGSDWFLSVKRNQEKTIGQKIPTEIENGD